MSNKAIIRKLKEQVQDLKDNYYTDDDKLRDWVNKTKIYILGLWLDKKDDNFKKEIINMLEKYRDNIPTYDNMEWYKNKEEAAWSIGKEILGMQGKLRETLESFIEIVEIREKDLETKENDTPKEGKKSKTKKKSD